MTVHKEGELYLVRQRQKEKKAAMTVEEVIEAADGLHRRERSALKQQAALAGRTSASDYDEDDIRWLVHGALGRFYWRKGYVIDALKAAMPR